MRIGHNVTKPFIHRTHYDQTCFHRGGKEDISTRLAVFTGCAEIN